MIIEIGTTLSVTLIVIITSWPMIRIIHMMIWEKVKTPEKTEYTYKEEIKEAKNPVS
jgi:hypothetical protein